MDLLSQLLVLAGRILFAFIFIGAGFGHLRNMGHTAQIAAASGAPFPKLSAWLASLLALLGGLSVAFGFMAQIGAVLLIVFLVPTTLLTHRFWGLDNPQEANMQKVHFLKNAALLGGAVMLLCNGSGPLSLTP
ncbi:hypothetical protein SD70_01835 [Gordoniibacillus kamchatkensis]|uniref:DoxX family protein n=1 Tax=Gordoniibacillus kamchatkensis TaxID=1590651 RepID=A0ABR5AMU6_9BACL|nr:DoxX family protein [Paenibacillus sp. VKM B-2647]KIL42360.1 hypothetical protein SD70_01835 [Paenibacillus sp. VKM B-2647]